MQYWPFLSQRDSDNVQMCCGDYCIAFMWMAQDPGKCQLELV